MYSKQPHVMVDIETLSKSNNAAMLSIGAVKFDPLCEGVIDSFSVDIDPTSCQTHGLKIDADTVMWWMSPERNAAREGMADARRVGLPEALYAFTDWLGGDLPVWGNGATFDNVILTSAFAACQIDRPWAYWNDRCYRTLKSLAPHIKLVRQGTFHNALHDAISQAQHMQAVVKYLRLDTV